MSELTAASLDFIAALSGARQLRMPLDDSDLHEHLAAIETAACKDAIAAWVGRYEKLAREYHHYVHRWSADVQPTFENCRTMHCIEFRAILANNPEPHHDDGPEFPPIETEGEPAPEWDLDPATFISPRAKTNPDVPSVATVEGEEG